MKVITTKDKIVSLENVKSVEKYPIERERHTSMGEPYYLYNSSIRVNYFGGDIEIIHLGDCTSKEKAEKENKNMMDRIFTELTKE